MISDGATTQNTRQFWDPRPTGRRTDSCRLALARRCSYALCWFTFTLIKINKQIFVIYSSRSH